MQEVNLLQFAFFSSCWCFELHFFILQDRNKAELERFEEERNRDFMNMLRGLVQTQVHC